MVASLRREGYPCHASSRDRLERFFGCEAPEGPEIPEGGAAQAGLYDGRSRAYIEVMASVLTIREQAETSDLARRVGGYTELMRLQDERHEIERAGGKAVLVKNPDGSFVYRKLAA